MGERLKQIPNMIIEFWNKYTSKQKTIILSVLAAVIFLLAILVAVFSRTEYKQLQVFATTKEAAEAKTMLSENGIEVKVSGNDATILSVDQKQYYDAMLILGENDMVADSGDDKSNVFDNSMSTTDYERKLKFLFEKQSDIEKMLETIDGVKSCKVMIHVPDKTNSIYKDEKESTISITLNTTDEFTKDASQIASIAANLIGSSTDSVRILDQSGTLLFSGTDSTDMGNASNALDIKNQVESNFNNSIRNVLISSGVYNDAQVAANLDIQINPDEIEKVTYSSNDEDDTGPVANTYTYEADNVEGLENLTGTDANGEEITDVALQNTTGGNSTVSVMKEEYNTSYEKVVSRSSVGQIHLDNSSIAVVLTKYKIYNEDEMEELGQLEGTTFAQFKSENSESTLIEVDESIITLISNASGIDIDRVSVLAYEVPVFYETENPGLDFENIVQIILASMIVLLILFVVFKGMKPVEVVELEPELSVEALLATTKENQTLDDIEFSEKSASRQQIEKFVDENPEAVAALLRNWLNEDWE